MPSMNDVLASIPGYGAYLAKRQMNEQAGMQDLQQAGALQGILASVQQQEKNRTELGREQAFRQEVAALGPNPTQEQMAQVASKYVQPAEALRTHQASLDRQATLQAGKETRAAALEQAKATADNTHAVRMSTIQNQALRDAETARHNRESEAIQKQIAELRGKTAEQPKPPAGYRYTQSGDMEAVPGGPADVKATGVFNADTANLESSTSGLNRMATTANELLNHPGLPGIYGLRGMIPNAPGSAAANAEAKLNNLKSQVGFSVLQAMRDASKTGGALGNISDAEGKRLEANLAALDKAQGVDQVRDELRKIVTFTEEAKGRLRNAYNTKHGERTGDSAPAPSAAPAAPQGPQEGATATNKATGQKIIFRGGQWQPM